MTALTDLSDVVNKLTGGNNGNPENLFVFINDRVAGAAAAATVLGRHTDLWQYEASNGAGGVPSTSVVPTRTTPGAMGQANPSGGRRKIALGMSLMTSVNGSYLLYDRLVHQGGLSGIVMTAQTTNLPTADLTRYTDGVGNMILLTIYSIVGTTARTATVSYRNQAGDLKTSKSFTIGATGQREAQRAIIVPLANGDTGVTKIESLTIAAGSTGTAGNFGLAIIHPLAIAHIDNIGSGQVVDFISGFPSEVEILPDACLSLLMVANSTVPPRVMFNLSSVEV